jgi:hypothetical protein
MLSPKIRSGHVAQWWHSSIVCATTFLEGFSITAKHNSYIWLGIHSQLRQLT